MAGKRYCETVSGNTVPHKRAMLLFFSAEYAESMIDYTRRHFATFFLLF